MRELPSNDSPETASPLIRRAPFIHINPQKPLDNRVVNKTLDPSKVNMLNITQVASHEITEQMLHDLVTAQATEDRNLEFKLDLKIATDVDKREFCTDVLAFANGS